MPPHERHAGTAASLRRVLSLPALVLFGLVYLVPMTVFTTYGLVTVQTGGRLPTTYLITLVAMTFTALSYGAMVRAFPAAGSTFTYAKAVFGPRIGFLAGWSLLLDYLFLPMINYLVIGLYLNTQFPAVPPWVFIVAAIVAATVLNVAGVESIARANVAIIGAQSVFVLTFLVMAIGAVDPLASAWEPFTGNPSYAAGGVDPSVGLGPLLGGAAVLCLSFLGFDAVSTMAEETPEPRRDIPRAILWVTLTGGLLFTLVSYVAHLVMREPRCLPAVDPSCTFADTAALDLMARAGGRGLGAFFIAAYVAGAFGSALTSQASVSRILYTMGRVGALPRTFFGRLAPRFGTPVPAILLVSAVSLLAAWLSLALLASMISFGALVAFSVVNLAVIKHHLLDARREPGAANRRPDYVRHGVLPAIGCVLTAWLWTSLSGESLTIGLRWLAAGALYLAWLTRGFTRQPPLVEGGEEVPIGDC
ncbi:MAG: APC family permease [Vicinamibacterales bacterium]